MNKSVAGSKAKIKDIDRKQLLLKTVDVEMLIPEDHEARAIWDFVGKLDLSAYIEEIKSKAGESGSPAINPMLLISLWIYSYSKGVSSAREISRLCEYDPAYQWLTGMSSINYHTISDFRVKHGDALTKLFSNVLGVLSSENLVTLERVMHDGTKIKAFSSNHTYKHKPTLEDHLRIAEKQVETLSQSDDDGVSERVKSARVRAANEKLETLNKAMDEYNKINSRRPESKKEKTRVSETDPEARIMKDGQGAYVSAYNVQLSTDEANKIIVGAGISQVSTDYKELIPSMDRIEFFLDKKPNEVVADGGYTSVENILEMHKKDISFIAPMSKGKLLSQAHYERNGVSVGFRGADKFIYDKENDKYICPAGKDLKYRSKQTLAGRAKYNYTASEEDCRGCIYKKECCPKSKQRMILIKEESPELKSFISKMETEEAKAIYKKRSAVAEFPNAWIKAKMKLRRFCVRGLEKVQMEILWACIAYNIKQWMRLRWCEC